MTQALTKFEVARRQLVTAIRLFFDDADSVSVYTLAHASLEVLDTLCKHAGTLRFMDQMVRANKRSEKELRKIVRHGRDFFKHADRDPNGVLEDFSDDLNDHVLITASMDFGEVGNSKPIEVQVFQVWYFAMYPEKVPLPEGQSILTAAERGFPGITQLSRAKQKAAGKRMLSQALRDPELINDSGTDRAPVRAIPSKAAKDIRDSARRFSGAMKRLADR